MLQIGPAIISDGEEWPVSRGLVRAMRAECARVRTPVGFGFSPDKVRDLIADGVRTIVLCTEDGDATPENTYSEIVERGFGALIGEFPAVRWVIEISNEPNMVNGLDMWTHRYFALETLKRLKPKMPFPNLRWAIGLPTNTTDLAVLLARDEHGCILDHIDVWTPHLYGWERLGDGAGDGGKWNDVLRYGLDQTTLPILITEAGIDDRATHRTEKARRYLDWASKADPRIEGLCIWGLGRWQDNPTYEIDMPMALELGKRTLGTPDVPPGTPPVPQPEPEPRPMGTPTLGPTLTTPEQAIAWARTKGAHQRFLDVIPLYYTFTARYTVPAENAVVQAGKETAFGNFTGVVPASYHNWCGLKTAQGGDNNDPEAHQKFLIDEMGVLAHIQHLAKYGGKVVPVEGDELLDPRAHLVTLGAAPTLEQLGGKWAPSPTYGNELAALRNQLVAFSGEQEPPPVATPLRIIVSAGHEGIQNITAEKIGQASANNLRGSTGALGREAEWTAPWANHLAFLLREAGVDAVRLGATYSDAYAQRADLVIAGHCDGVTNATAPQHCQAAAVVSGNSFDSADAKAKAFVDRWYQVYPERAGIKGNGPVTVGMTQYYGGWYRTPDTPMVLIEHGILGAGNKRRTDFPTPEEAAQIDFDVIAQHFGLTAQPQEQEPPRPVERHDPETGVLIGGGFRDWYEDLERRIGFENAVVLIGRFITEEIVENGLTVQYTQRYRLEHHPGERPPFDVIGGLVGTELLAARKRITDLEAELAARP